MPSVLHILHQKNILSIRVKYTFNDFQNNGHGRTYQDILTLTDTLRVAKGWKGVM